MLGTFFTLTASNTDSVVSTAKDLIGDVTPLLIIIVGVSVGLFIYWGLIKPLTK
jgi:type II secretory pathway component PulF